MHVDYKSLSFGVELEFTQIQRAVAANVVADYFDTRPVQIGDWGFDNYEIKDRTGRVWRIVKDGSIKAQRKENGSIVEAPDDYQCELVSPILYYQDIPLLQGLLRDLREEDANYNRSCGMHVHIGAEWFSSIHLRNLCNIVYSKQSLLINALNVTAYRNQYCMSLSDMFIKNLNQKKPETIEQFSDVWYYGENALNYRRSDRYNESRYRILNLHNLFSGRYKTVEFRLFNSTMHAGVLKSNIQLSLLIAAQALNQRKTTSRITLTDNEKYTFRVWLLRMGATTDEFKSMRYHLLKYLSGNSAWRNPPSNQGESQSVFETEISALYEGITSDV